MKTRLSLFAIILACVSLSASSAAAEVDKAKLIGAWSGELVTDSHGVKRSHPIAMTFKKDGTVTVKLQSSGKSGEAKYRIDGDNIVLSEEGKSQKITLTKVTLTANSISGGFEFDENKSFQPSVYMAFSMKRGK